MNNKDWFNKDKKPGKVQITKFPSEKKPIQKSMAELIEQMKLKPKPPKQETKKIHCIPESKYYNGDEPPWE